MGLTDCAVWALIALGAFALHVGATLLFYCAVMALMAARDAGRLRPGPLAWFGHVVLYVGFVLDLTLNVVWGTIVFLDPPADWLLTLRLIRYKREQDGWRCRFATWICVTLLDPVAPDGCHCKA